MSAYIKFANIAKGDSQAQDHSGDAGWINLLSVSFGTTRSIKTPTGAGAFSWRRSSSTSVETSLTRRWIARRRRGCRSP